MATIHFYILLCLGLFFVPLNSAPSEKIHAKIILSNTVSILTPQGNDEEWLSKVPPTYLNILKHKCNKSINSLADIQFLLGKRFRQLIARTHPEWEKEQIKITFTNRLLCLLEIIALSDPHVNEWPKKFEICGDAIDLVYLPALPLRDEKLDNPNEARLLVYFELCRNDSDILQRAGKDEINQMYELLAIINKLCRDYSYPYIAIGGTCLGAIRHQGIIPWDDEVNLAMPKDKMEQFLTDERILKVLNQEGIQWTDWLGGKLFYFQEKVYDYKQLGNSYYYPSLNILLLEQNETKKMWEPFYINAKRLWPNQELFTFDDLDHPIETKFGPLSMFIPKDYHLYLTRRYGPNYNQVATVRWNQPKGSQYKGFYYLVKNKRAAAYTGKHLYIQNFADFNELN